MSVQDRDLGLKRVYRAAEKFARRFTVGVHADQEAAEYAMPIEGATRFMRDTFDARQGAVDQQLQDLHFAIVNGGDPESLQEQIAEEYAEAFRDAAPVSTGDLQEAIDVRRGK